ncbi:unnamed protein product [Dovyalis caffra]|uniref:Uncharacterized protein n=1 Tax=Dovyalis caffra TaxID=77055 RepID=A0AAV1RKE3_9ROSI|nr:unnamed protein product [Dovyalis caffra]
MLPANVDLLVDTGSIQRILRRSSTLSCSNSLVRSLLSPIFKQWKFSCTIRKQCIASINDKLLREVCRNQPCNVMAISTEVLPWNELQMLGRAGTMPKNIRNNPDDWL